MTVHVAPPDRESLERVRKWRIKIPEALRTPYLLTVEQQEQYYLRLCDRSYPARMWCFWEVAEATPRSAILLGFGGLEGIQWENGRAELSIIMSPDHRGQGYGTQIVAEILRRAFQELRLLTVVAEVYTCNPALVFWEKFAEGEYGKRYGPFKTSLPRTKYWQGRLFDSQVFTFIAP